MARHPNLTEQLSIGFKGLFKRTSRRASVRKRRANTGSAVKLKTAKVPASTPPAISKQAAPAATKAVSKPKTASKPGNFWSDLFLVRPWLLVGGLWLTFIVLIVIALSGLSSPGRETVLEPVSSSIDGQPLSAPDAAAASRLVLRGEQETALTRHDPAATLPGKPEQSMPAWPLLVMVAACAGGCMLVSRQGVLTAEPRRARRRGVAQAAGPRPMRSASKLSSGRNRRAKRRIGAQRPASQVMAFSSGQKIRHTPLQQPQPSRSVSFSVGGPESPTSVAVVPSSETSPLDWKEGSLAHKLDVRQTRSINSFL